MSSTLPNRRGGRTILFAIVTLMGLYASAGAQPAPVSAGPVDAQLIDDLVAANRILADQGVLDGWGHVSVRHPRDPNRYLLSRSLVHGVSLGTAYAVWTGIGAAGTALIGIGCYGEPASTMRLACLAMLIGGIIGLKLFAPA